MCIFFSFFLVPRHVGGSKKFLGPGQGVFSLIPSLASLWIRVSISLSQGFQGAGKWAWQNLPHLLCEGVGMRI